ncbi:MAG TPA: response regulator transcription factor [Bryobacteraceae bacterium]|nr:response regulator transcription factor [Bryobacteraceae bacterium]
MIRVLVLARSTVVRAGLESIVQASATLELAGELAGASEWAHFSQADLQDTDVLLADLGDIEPDAVAALGRLPVPVVVLLLHADVAWDEILGAALRSGIRGILSTESGAEEIEGAIQAVHAGLVAITPAGSAVLLGKPRRPEEALPEPLSDRELEVLNRIAEGLSNKIIAYRLEISEHTVKTHVTAILAKLGASSRTEAVAQAIRRGLIML